MTVVVKTFPVWLAGLVGLVVVGSSYFLGLYGSNVLVFIGIVGGGGLAIAAVAAWLGQRTDRLATSNASRMVCWSNLVTWVLPPLGIFTSAYALGMQTNHRSRRQGLIVLATVCLLLSLVNVAIGALLGVRADDRSEQAVRDRVVVITKEIGPDEPLGMQSGPLPLGWEEREVPSTALRSITTVPCVPPDTPASPPMNPAVPAVSPTTSRPFFNPVPSQAGPTTEITLVGCGSFVLASNRLTYAPDSAAITAAYEPAGDVRLRIHGDRDWDIQFGPPAGRPLARGLYSEVPGYRESSGQMGRFSLQGSRVCEGEKSTFRVYEIRIIADVVARFLATFEHRCATGTGANIPPSYGVVDFSA